MPRRLLIILIKHYQKFVSPFLVNTCRFHPSCSHYSKQALEKHGFFKGMGLTIVRILKCHPYHPGGYDPVP